MDNAEYGEFTTQIDCDGWEPTTLSDNEKDDVVQWRVDSSSLTKREEKRDYLTMVTTTMLR